MIFFTMVIHADCLHRRLHFRNDIEIPKFLHGIVARNDQCAGHATRHLGRRRTVPVSVIPERACRMIRGISMAYSWSSPGRTLSRTLSLSIGAGVGLFGVACGFTCNPCVCRLVVFHS